MRRVERLSRFAGLVFGERALAVMDIMVVVMLVGTMAGVVRNVQAINASRFTMANAASACTLPGMDPPPDSLWTCQRLDYVDAWIHSREYVPGLLDSLLVRVEALEAR